ncbi:MAG: hypothetical protein WAT79_00115 [Saprospiraceae bacterium]
MNSAHFHLLVNHFPIIVPIIALLILVGGFIFRSEIVKRTALVLFVFGAVATFPTMFSGEEAEEIVEKIPGITESVIEHHEEMAETFAFSNYGLGLLALFALWAEWKKKSFAKLTIYVIAIFAIVVIFLGSRAGTSGGEIRHTEIRDSYQMNMNNNQNVDLEKEDNDD